MSGNHLPLGCGENVVQFGDFHFDSLRKYMQPLYAMLIRNENQSSDEKRLIHRQAVAGFLKRLRTYRDRSIEDLAAQLNLRPEDLKQIESGEAEIDRKIFMPYIEKCYGERELYHFSERLREFQTPSIRSTKMAIAHDALKRFGIIMDGVDYKSLHTPRGQCLAFPRTRREDSTAHAEGGGQEQK